MRVMILLLLAASVGAQTVPKKLPHYIPTQPQWTASNPSGVWDAPRTAWDSVRDSLFGRLTWKHFKTSYPRLRGRVRYCRVENMTHHLPYFFDHDPRNLVLTDTSFEFDAVAGDLIAWKVWAQ